MLWASTWELCTWKTRHKQQQEHYWGRGNNISIIQVISLFWFKKKCFLLIFHWLTFTPCFSGRNTHTNTHTRHIIRCFLATRGRNWYFVRSKYKEIPYHATHLFYELFRLTANLPKLYLPLSPSLKEYKGFIVFRAKYYMLSFK